MIADGVRNVPQRNADIPHNKGKYMADTTKLASTFRAWRVTFAVPTEHLVRAVARCMDLGVQPRACGYQEEEVLFSITIPCGSCDHPKSVVDEHLKGFHAQIVNAVRVELICPLSS